MPQSVKELRTKIEFKRKRCTEIHALLEMVKKHESSRIGLPVGAGNVVAYDRDMMLLGQRTQIKHIPDYGGGTYIGHTQAQSEFIQQLSDEWLFNANFLRQARISEIRDADGAVVATQLLPEGFWVETGVARAAF